MCTPPLPAVLRSGGHDLSLGRRYAGVDVVAESDAKRVIAEEVGRVVQSPVISHIDIENMQANVQRRSLLTGRKRRMSRSRATARRADRPRARPGARHRRRRWR